MMSALPLIQCMLEQAYRHKIPPEMLLSRARACGVDALLWHAVTHEMIDAERYGLTQAMREAFMLEQTARLAIWRRSVQKALQTLSMPSILLKGAPLGERLMGDSIWRMTHDIDLWISKDQVETAETELAQAGWHRAQEPHLWATNQILLEHEVLAPIELHWSMAPRPWQTPSFEKAMQTAEPYAILDVQAHILSEDDLWLHLLVHAHQHYFALKTVLDLMEAHDKLQIHPEHLKPYHLGRLHAFVTLLIQAASQPETYSISGQMIKCWFGNLLSHTQRGELVFGADSRLMAAAGVVLRAFSMGLMDGLKMPVLSALDVIFAGPHRIGAKCHTIFDAVVKK